MPNPEFSSSMRLLQKPPFLGRLRHFMRSVLVHRQKREQDGSFESKTGQYNRHYYSVLVESFLQFSGQTLLPAQVEKVTEILARPMSRRQFLRGTLSFSGLFATALADYQLDTSRIGLFLSQFQRPEQQSDSSERYEFQSRFYENIHSIDLEFIDRLGGELHEFGVQFAEVLAPLGFQQRWEPTVFSVVENLKLLKQMSLHAEQEVDDLQSWSQDLLQNQYYELGSAVWAVLQLYYTYVDRKEELRIYVATVADTENEFQVDLADFEIGNVLAVPILLADQVLSLHSLWTSFRNESQHQPDPILKLLSARIQFLPSESRYGPTAIEPGNNSSDDLCGLGYIPVSRRFFARVLSTEFYSDRGSVVASGARPAEIDIIASNPILKAKILERLQAHGFDRLVSQLRLSTMRGKLVWGGGGEYGADFDAISIGFVQRLVETAPQLEYLPTDAGERRAALEAYFQNVEVDETTLWYVLFHELGHSLYQRINQILDPEDKLHAMKLVESLLLPYRKYDDLDFFAQYLENQFQHGVERHFYGTRFDLHTVADYSFTILLKTIAPATSVAGSPEVQVSCSSATVGFFNLLSRFCKSDEEFFIFRNEMTADYSNLREWWRAKYEATQNDSLSAFEQVTLQLLDEKITGIAWPSPDEYSRSRIFPGSEYNLILVVLLQIFKEQNPTFISALEETISGLEEEQQVFIRHAFAVSQNQLDFLLNYADQELFGQVISYGILGDEMEIGELPAEYDHSVAEAHIRELRTILEKNALALREVGADTLV